jgi:hypothetical protein
MLFRERVAVYCEDHTEHINTLCVGRMQSFSVLKQVVHIAIILMSSCGGGLEYLHRILRVAEGDEKGTQCLGDITGPLCHWGT